MHLSDMLSTAFLDYSGDEINLDWSKVNAVCTYDINQQKETMMPVEQPGRPFLKVAVDLFEWDVPNLG